MVDFDNDYDEDEDFGNDFGRVPSDQECDHCGKPATHASGDHYSCDDHSDD
ncbi:hypothetical protein [Rahnella sp. Larv3_ips]|uniref:hypothetical protein n=1 Tax=Rahnella sp. Larv3_ips TaxID=1896943 RepID=UPI0013CE5C30|nr:hypothetical protein [Rahnella sp. Larv3_ips]